MSLDAFIAATRFGLGPRPGDLAAYADGPRERLIRELDAPLPPTPDLMTSAEAYAEFSEFRQRKKTERLAARLEKREKERFENVVRPIYIEEVGQRYQRFVSTDAPFKMRLVAFWSNHFTVSVARGTVMPLAGAFEREAIAPYVTGRFVDLLKAAVLHPAMVQYLDQRRSVGPLSEVGLARKVGLNENLGREVIELHTLGAGAGYGQADVVAMAEILTGWTVRETGDGDPVEFDLRRHQPGPKTLLGAIIPESGEGEAAAALALLAGHPATATHLATKLVRHFVADEPPAEAVERIAAVFRETGGDLRAVSAALVRLDAAWAEPLPKVRTPWDLVVALGRAAGGAELYSRDQAMLRALRELGQPPFRAPSPAGWADRASAWLGAEALMRRIELARETAGRIAVRTDLDALVESTIRPVISEASLGVLRRAGSRAEAIALVFASPQFQRR